VNCRFKTTSVTFNTLNAALKRLNDGLKDQTAQFDKLNDGKIELDDS
jgi:hypothetical protein